MVLVVVDRNAEVSFDREWEFAAPGLLIKLCVSYRCILLLCMYIFKQNTKGHAEEKSGKFIGL